MECYLEDHRHLDSVDWLLINFIDVFITLSEYHINYCFSLFLETIVSIGRTAIDDTDG